MIAGRWARWAGPETLAPLLRRAAIVWEEPRYERAFGQLATEPADRMHLLWPERMSVRE